jgi:hypothetical protein
MCNKFCHLRCCKEIDGRKMNCRKWDVVKGNKSTMRKNAAKEKEKKVTIPTSRLE